MLHKLVLCALVLLATPAYALKTASSLDINWATASLNVNTGGPPDTNRSVSSSTGFELDYNVALFDYKTIATLQFLQFSSSNVGSSPFSRVAIAGAYHFLRVNGQRALLDNQVEAKSWGISPAVELSIGLSKLSINDSKAFAFTSSFVDVMPRFNVEIPMSSTFLLLVKAGYYNALGSSSTTSPYQITLKGMILEVGFKLTTL